MKILLKLGLIALFAVKIMPSGQVLLNNQVEASQVKVPVEQFIEDGKLEISGRSIDMEIYQVIFNDGKNVIVREDHYYDGNSLSSIDCKSCPDKFTAKDEAYHLIYEDGKIRFNTDVSSIIPYFSIDCPMIDSLQDGIITIRTGNRCGAASASSTKYYYRSYDLMNLNKDGTPRYLNTVMTYTAENYIVVAMAAFFSGIPLLVYIIGYFIFIRIKGEKLLYRGKYLGLSLLGLILCIIIFSTPFLMDEVIRFEFQEEPFDYNLGCFYRCLG